MSSSQARDLVECVQVELDALTTREQDERERERQRAARAPPIERLPAELLVSIFSLACAIPADTPPLVQPNGNVHQDKGRNDDDDDDEDVRCPEQPTTQQTAPLGRIFQARQSSDASILATRAQRSNTTLLSLRRVCARWHALIDGSPALWRIALVIAPGARSAAATSGAGAGGEGKAGASASLSERTLKKARWWLSMARLVATDEQAIVDEREEATRRAGAIGVLVLRNFDLLGRVRYRSDGSSALDALLLPLRLVPCSALSISAQSYPDRRHVGDFGARSMLNDILSAFSELEPCRLAVQALEIRLALACSWECHAADFSLLFPSLRTLAVDCGERVRLPTYVDAGPVTRARTRHYQARPAGTRTSKLRALALRNAHFSMLNGPNAVPAPDDADDAEETEALRALERAAPRLPSLERFALAHTHLYEARATVWCDPRHLREMRVHAIQDVAPLLSETDLNADDEGRGRARDFAAQAQALDTLAITDSPAVAERVLRDVQRHGHVLSRLREATLVLHPTTMVLSALGGAHAPALTNLTLDGSPMLLSQTFPPGGASGLSWPASMPALETLSLARCAWVTDDLIAQLERAAPKLARLNLAGNAQLTGPPIVRLVRARGIVPPPAPSQPAPPAPSSTFPEGARGVIARGRTSAATAPPASVRGASPLPLSKLVSAIIELNLVDCTRVQQDAVEWLRAHMRAGALVYRFSDPGADDRRSYRRIGFA